MTRPKKQPEVSTTGKRYHVFSKMAADVTYNDYAPGGADIPVLLRSVTIRGGAGVANKNIITPLGFHTEISQEDMEFLNRNGIFCLHRDNGFVTIQERNAPIEQVIPDLTEESDPSSPITPMDYVDKEGPQILEV